MTTKTFAFINPDRTSTTVFASSYAHAVSVYVLYRETRDGQFPTELCLDVWHPPQGHTDAHLDVALGLGLQGIGYHFPGTGWSILAATELLPTETAFPSVFDVIATPAGAIS